MAAVGGGPTASRAAVDRCGPGPAGGRLRPSPRPGGSGSRSAPGAC